MLQETFIELIVENFKVINMLENMIKDIYRLDSKKAEKYERQKDWYIGKNTSLMGKNNIKIVNLKGKLFEDGMNIEIINAEEIGKIDEKEKYYIEQMVEPIVLKDDKIIKIGKAILKKMEE